MLRSHFSDQSKFCIEFGDRGVLVWITKDERYNPAYLKSSVKFPTSVMVWNCVSTRGIGNIVFLKSTVTADVYMYMEVLEIHLLSFIEDLYGICMASVWRWRHDFSATFGSCTLLEKGQDMATGVEHSNARLASQQFWPKHYWRSVEHYEEMHEK